MLGEMVSLKLRVLCNCVCVFIGLLLSLIETCVGQNITNKHQYIDNKVSLFLSNAHAVLREDPGIIEKVYSYKIKLGQVITRPINACVESITNNSVVLNLLPQGDKITIRKGEVVSNVIFKSNISVVWISAKCNEIGMISASKWMTIDDKMIMRFERIFQNEAIKEGN